MAETSDFNSSFRQALEDLDVALIRKLWAHVRPGMPQPKTDEEALIIAHNARTQAVSISFKNRAYSHTWLVERGYPTGLPDELKPRAQRIYPVTVKAVGISVNGNSAIGRAIAGEIRTAMEGAVLEAYADGRQDDVEFIKSRMAEARGRTSVKLLGRIGRKD